MTVGAIDAPSPFPLTDMDRLTLAQTDDEFNVITWEDLKDIIERNALELLRRWPSDIKRYMKWCSAAKEKYGTVQNYVMEERLHWEPSPTSTSDTGPMFAVQDKTPFKDSRDWKILPNDWPYGLAPGITHIIVWLKTPLESVPPKGDLSPDARQRVEDFIQEAFVNRIRSLPGSEDKVTWFRNWRSLQSVPGMEHVHVLVRDVPDDIILDWTNGERIKQETFHK